MSGIVGAYKLPSSLSKETIHDRLRGMLAKLENRGQNGFGFVAFRRDGGFRPYNSSRPPSDSMAFPAAAQVTGYEIQHHAAIAHIGNPDTRTVSSADIQPVSNRDYSADAPHHPLFLSFNGALVNGPELHRELSDQGIAFCGTTDAEILLRLIEFICQRDYWNHDLALDYEKLFREVDRRVDGAVSALIVDGEGTLVTFRNRGGLRPLEFIHTDDGFLLFASENCAFQGLRGKREAIPPSHIKIINGQSGEAVNRFVGDVRHAAKLCAYETLYLGSPSTIANGHYHLETRHNIGMALGEMLAPKFDDESADHIIVSSMPRTGQPYADGLFAGLAQRLGHRVERCEVIEVESRQRTLIGITEERKSLIESKYRAAGDAVAGKTIIIADEALIRGDTSEAVTGLLMKSGARSVHWAIGSPPIVAPNYYGMGIDTLDELAFWQAWQKLTPQLKQRALRLHQADPAALRLIEGKIAEHIKAASVTYLPFGKLVELLPGGREQNDLSAFTLEMPTPAGQRRANANLYNLLAGLSLSCVS